MSCDIGEAAEGLENEMWRRWSDVRVGEWGKAALPTSQLILQPIRCFTYVIGASPTAQLILQPFFRFSYVTAHLPTLPLLHLNHSSFSNPSFASPTSQALHLRHLASRPCRNIYYYMTRGILFLSIVYGIYSIMGNWSWLITYCTKTVGIIGDSYFGKHKQTNVPAEINTINYTRWKCLPT